MTLDIVICVVTGFAAATSMVVATDEKVRLSYRKAACITIYLCGAILGLKIYR